MKKILILFTALLFIAWTSAAQDNRRGGAKEKAKTGKYADPDDEEEEEDAYPVPRFEFGLNFGTYFANKYSANYYNGTPQNVNNINYVMSNPYWRRDIRKSLGIGETDTVTQLTVDGYPLNMHYNVAFMGGLFRRLNFNRKNSLFLQVNYTQLKAEDVVTMKIYNPYAPATLAPYAYEAVAGREGRVMIDLGYQRSFPLKSRINLFIQAAATMCYTQMLQSDFVVEGREYDMVNIYGNNIYVPNTPMQTVYVNQNAFGFGGFLGVGAGIPLTEMFGIEPGFYSQVYPTNLEHYEDFRPSFGAYLRILLNFVTTEDRYQ